MLNEFFGSFVSKRLYGVPLSLILAVGFSAFEVSIGIFIFMLEGKVAEGNDIRANIWEIIAYLTVLCLIAIECYFYSMLSASMDVGLVSELFAPDRVPAWLRFWLAPFGFVVVIGLVFMGHTFIEGLDQVRENGAIGQFRREMRKVQRIAQTLGDDFGHARESLGTLNLSLSAFHTELVGNDGQGPQASVRLEEAATAMKQAANDAAQARREPYACVAEADGLALLRTHLAFAIATLVAIGVLVWGEILFLRHLGVFGDAGPGMVTMISAGQSLLVLGAGWLLVPKVRLLPDDASQQLQSSPGRLSLQIAAIATLIFVGGFNVFLTLGQNGRPEWLWLAILLGCISFIAAVGSALPVLIAACWVAVETVGLAIGSAVVAVAALLAWFSAVTVAVLRAVLHWVAFPAMKTVELIRPSRGLTSVLPAGAQSDR